MENTKSNNKMKLSLIVLCILIMLQYLYPVADLLPSLTQIGVFIFWIICIRSSKLIGKAIKLNIISIFILLVTFIRCLAADQLNMNYYSSFQVVIARYQFVVYSIIYIYIMSLNKKDKKIIFNWIVFCITITVIFSLYYVLCVDPQAIRNTQRDYLWGVGDFQLMYAIAIIFGPLLFLIIDKLKNNKKCFGLLCSFILMGICLLLCNLVTSVVIAIFSVFITYCITRKNKVIYLIIGFFSMVAVFLKSFFSNLLMKLAEKNLFYWSTNNKIIAIANVLKGDMTNIDTLSRRMMLINQSLKSFQDNPFFGINFKEHVEGKIGCHSQWADDLGRYGIFGNIIIWYNYIKIAKMTIRYKNDKIMKNNMMSVWISFFILGFLNPCLSGTILMAMFVWIPTFDIN